MNNLNIYLLKDLSPEVKAVTFAKCSRSPDSFKDIAKELTEDKSRKFHEKWVVGYGHSSVAEHATLSIAIENISILGTKVIEDNRLASYTEKSTRYQLFNKDTYYIPETLKKDPELLKLYTETSDYLFNQYELFNIKVSDYLKTKIQKEGDISDIQYNTKIKSKTCDTCRYLLTTATQTNLGITINARSLEYAIKKLLSHPLEEMQRIGRVIKDVALEETPTLIKYATESKYLIETEKNLTSKIKNIIGKSESSDQNYVTLVDYDKDAENKLILALLYKYSTLSYNEIQNKLNNISQKEKEEIIDIALKDRSDFDQPIRELEHIYYSFDILTDYGAFRDIQRHRICTQTNQLLTCDYGYETPEIIKEVGLENEYNLCLEKAKKAYDQIQNKYPYEAQYILPLAFRKRVLITLNLRELHHFISLRSGIRGHWFYRMIAQECYKKIEEIHPLLAKYIRVNMD